MPSPPIATLGMFDVHETLGEGGMGVVRRGVHRPTGLPVAIKVLAGAPHLRPDFVAAFRAEVRAVASLNHPSIIRVLDHGEVSEEAAARSGGALEAAGPYLVMELMPGGTLSRARTYPWPVMRSVLMGLLDALAHAHARGVLHRDIKRGNVLVAHPDGPGRGLRLTDFGIAHITGSAEEEGVFGSPSYMAPEQCLGEWRSHGPWTDLYGVGCLAWSLATGAPPFRGSYAQLLEAHVGDEPPDFVPQHPVPDALEGWLRHLLAKRPEDRPRYAAEAAAMIREFGPAAPGPALDDTADAPWAERASGPQDDLSVSDRATRSAASVTRRFALGEPSATLTLRALRTVPELEVPATWRRPRPPRPPMRLVGAGLGLYGLREVPLAGREAERDTIWAALRDVADEGRAAFVLIRGGAGSGKSRLARWIAERAHECGVGSVWRALHGPVAGPIDGLGPMVARKLGCVGLSRDEARERLGALLADEETDGDYERDALVELVAPGDDRDHRVLFTNPVERHVLVRRALERDARRGPVIVHLDDVQWGLDALAFAQHVLKWQRGSPSPILLLATLRSEALIDESLEDLQLREVLRRDRTQVLELGPLGAKDHRDLVGGLLGLSGTLAADVRRRTAGNPLFATQLVGDWVRRGVLVPGPSGFVLRDGERAALPDDIHEVWVRRLDPVLGTAGDGDPGWAAVEIAAALGQSVDAFEWQAACAEAGVDPPERLVDGLAHHGLVLPEPAGFQWLHGMLRESIERASRERGTWPRWNRACAAMVRARQASGQPPDHARLGVHLLAAGDLEAALEPLARGARRARQVSELPLGLRLLDQREQALSALGIPQSDERWGMGWTIRSVLYNALGRMDESRRWAERAVDAGRRHGWGQALALGLQCAAWGPFWAGDLPRARALLEECLAWHADHDVPGDEAGAEVSLAYVAMFAGDPAEARRRSIRAEELHQGVGNPIGAVEAFRLRATVERMDGNYDESMRVSREVIARMERLGNRIGAAEAHNELAETARYVEDWDRAERHYRKALAVYVERGSKIALIMRTNLSLLMLAQGRLVEAEAMLGALPARIPVEDSWLVACVVALARMAVAAGKADWDAWDREAATVDRIAAAGRAHDRDTAWTAGIAAGIAEEMGAPERARAARELADRLREPPAAAG